MEQTSVRSRRILFGFSTVILVGVLTAALFHWLLVFSIKDSKDHARWVNTAGKTSVFNRSLL